jgi:hypothetical protein
LTKTKKSNINKTMQEAKKENKEIKITKKTTPEEMARFAKKFNPNQWTKLCRYQDFYNLLLEDIGAAGVLAEKILADKWNGKTVFH